jgi:hypothetical protein
MRVSTCSILFVFYPILKPVKYLSLLLALLVLFGSFCLSCKNTPLPSEDALSEETNDDDEAFIPDLPVSGEPLPVSAFEEIWTYVLTGREEFLKPGLPLTDIGYFSADIGIYGSLVGVPDRKKLPPFSGRVHLVVKCDSKSTTYFALRPGSAERKALIADLIHATKDYDGLQIDFENIPERAGESFHSFLAELRAGLGHNKMFTIALKARTRKINNDIYDYEKIMPMVDRILIMAYDEHWSTSKPGPVASLSWCRNVARYSLNVIGKEKLIMGLPFYGRGWGDTLTSQAHVYTGIERIINSHNITDIKRENGIPTFDYTTPVKVKVYYDDEYSLSARMEMYRTMGVTSVGFWRLGQENPAVWNYLKIQK